MTNFDELKSLFCSNFSVLILGAPGSGKSYLVDSVLKTVKTKRVDLCGLIHTQESALESMLLQLKVDSLESLSTPVVVVVDNMDRFTQQRQSLLYTLFDTCYNTSFFSVIGMSCKLDIVSQFEKRVKSRFSQRFICLTPQLNEYTDDYREIEAIQKNGMEHYLCEESVFISALSNLHLCLLQESLSLDIFTFESMFTCISSKINSKVYLKIEKSHAKEAFRELVTFGFFSSFCPLPVYFDNVECFLAVSSSFVKNLNEKHPNRLYSITK